MFGLKKHPETARPVGVIRDAELSDMDAIVEIDSFSMDAWGEHAMSQAARNVGNRFLVAEVDRRVVGFGLYAYLKPAFELGRVEVLRAFRRQGVGSQIVRQVTSECFAGLPKGIARKTYIRATLSESDVAGLCFLRHCGFRDPKILRDYFGDEDGIRQFWQPPLDDLLPDERGA